MKIDIKQLEFIHTTLRDVLRWVEVETGIEFTIDDVRHGLPLRRICLSISDGTAGIQIEKFINDHWSYDPTRPNLKCCSLEGSGFGIYLSVRTNSRTRRIKQ